jgi:hypothetical protein
MTTQPGSLDLFGNPIEAEPESKRVPAPAVARVEPKPEPPPPLFIRAYTWTRDGNVTTIWND